MIHRLIGKRAVAHLADPLRLPRRTEHRQGANGQDFNELNRQIITLIFRVAQAHRQIQPIVDMPGALAEDRPRVGFVLAAGLQIDLREPHRVQVFTLLVKVVKTRYPIQPVLETGAQELHFLGDLLMLVNVDQIGHAHRRAILVPGKVTIKAAQRRDGLHRQFVSDVPFNDARETPNIQFLFRRIGAVIVFLAAVVYVATVKAKRIVEVRRLFARQKLEGKRLRHIKKRAAHKRGRASVGKLRGNGVRRQGHRRPAAGGDAHIHGLDARCQTGAAVLPLPAVIAGEGDVQIVSGLPAQRAAGGEHILIAQLLAVKHALHIAILLKSGEGKTAKQVVRKRHIHRAASLHHFIRSHLDIDLAAEFLIGLLAGHANGAADGVAAKQSPLGAPQHLNPLQVNNVQHRADGTA